MLKAPEGGTLELRRPLSKRSVQILIKIFSDKINILGIANQGKTANNPNWLLGQPNFTHEESDKLNRCLKRFGLKIAARYANVNSILCYREVGLHNDREIPVGGGNKMQVHECSFVFVPLYGHTGAIFSIGDDHHKKDMPIQDGHVIILDHNTDHEVRFPTYSLGLKYGLSFFADKISTPPPPSA